MKFRSWCYLIALGIVIYLLTREDEDAGETA